MEKNRLYIVKEVVFSSLWGDYENIHVTVGLRFTLHEPLLLPIEMSNVICWLCVLYWKLILPVDLRPLLEFLSAGPLIIWPLLRYLLDVSA